MREHAFLLALVFAAGALYLFMIQGTKYWLRRRLSHKVSQRKCACLTFDDGPHPVLTPMVLDLLERAGVRATFFVVGRKAEKDAALIARIARAGHEVGEHGYSHLHAWLTNPIRLASDLWKCSRAMRAFHLDSRPVLFRPPHGKLSFMTWLYVIIRGRRLAFWNTDPKDYASKSGTEVAQYVTDRIENGAVVLLHDGNGNMEEDMKNYVTAKALALILRDAAARNIRFLPLGEALGLRRTKRVQL